MGTSDFGSGETSTQDQTGASDEGTEEEAAEEQDGEGFDVLFSLINTSPMYLDQLIDEPVTSGNEGPSDQVFGSQRDE